MVEPINADPRLTEIEKKLKRVKIYTSPRVEKLGDLRSLTLGTSPGMGESAGTLTFYTAGFPQDFGG